MNFRELLNTETEGWFSQPIGSVEGCTVTARVMQNVQADFHVHKHSDEMFIVLKGRLVLEFEAESIVLLTGQTHTVKEGCAASGQSRRPSGNADRHEAEQLTSVMGQSPGFRTIAVDLKTRWPRFL